MPRTSQNTHSPSQQIKENPAISEASAGTVERGDGIGGFSLFNPTRSFLSRKTKLQVRLIPYPLTAKGRCSGLCREPVRTQIHLANKSKKIPYYSRQLYRALALLVAVMVLVGPAFLIPRYQEVFLITENHVVGLTHSLPIDRERWVLETLPLSARTSPNIHSPSQQINENLAILEASAGTVGRGDGTGGSNLFNPKRSFSSRKTVLQV
jgi:hypothetical protein